MADVDDARAIMGDDSWPYAIEKNRATLEAICQYAFEQGLAARMMAIEELFALETLDEFKIFERYLYDRIGERREMQVHIAS